MKNLKRILALITVILIVGFILATFVIAFLDFPGKTTVLFTCMLCIIVFPIIAWVLMWMFGAATGRKNVASYRTKEMEETMQKADEIRIKQALDATSGPTEESPAEES